MSAATDLSIPRIKADEGCRLKAYPDPLSGGEPCTIGWGATGPDIGPSTVWTQEQADEALIDRVTALDEQIADHLPWYGLLGAVRQAVLICMAYQLGLNGLLGFKHTLAACCAGQYLTAADLMLQSAWATQTPARAQRLSAWMRTGIAQPLTGD